MATTTTNYGFTKYQKNNNEHFSVAQDSTNWDKADAAIFSKNTVYYQTTAPTGNTYKINDIWKDTDNGNAEYYWNGTSWASAQYGTNAIADKAITSAKIADNPVLAKGLQVSTSIVSSGYSVDDLPVGVEAVAMLRNTTLATPIARIAAFIKSAANVLTYRAIALGAYISNKFALTLNADGTADFGFNVTSAANITAKNHVTTIQALTDGATINWDMSLGGIATITLGDNRTLSNPTNIVAGAKYVLQIMQDATGSRTLTYGSNYRFPGGVTPVLSSTANAIDIIEFTSFDGTLLILANFVPDCKAVV